jgi:N-dimethylarginine dimethylaminohydrolase
MAPPTHFAVDYSINPWMDTAVPVDTALAMTQWQALCRIYQSLGHRVDVIEPVALLPDMVYAANGGLIVNSTAVVARFRHVQRAAEALAHAEWMTTDGYLPVSTRAANEGQGDLLVIGSMILAGTGFRTDHAAHTEIATITGLPVISLHLCNPRFYHLDTALAVLDETTIAYYPPAFTAHSRATLRSLFPAAIEVASADAYLLGLNAVSDGRHVVHPAAAAGFAAQLREAGFEPIAVDLSELLKGGGSVKCCTLEVHP